MSRPGFMFYFDWQHILRALSDDQRGKLVLAMVDYAEREQMPHFDDPVTAMAWNALWPRLDEDKERYEAVTNKRRDAATKRWSPTPPQHSAPRRTNTPPTRQEMDDGMDKYLDW